MAVAEIRRMIKSAKNVFSFKRQSSGELHLKREPQRAPEGTNAFFLSYVGTNVQEMGGETLIVNREECADGICTEIIYDVTDREGVRTFLQAHVRADDTMEHGYSFSQSGRIPYDTVDLDFDATVELVKKRILERIGPADGPDLQERIKENHRNHSSR